MNRNVTSAPVNPAGNDKQQADLIHASSQPNAVGSQGQGLTAALLLRRSLERFLAKDIRGWADLCDENVVVEFPFAPDAPSRRIVGRSAIYEYLRDYPNVIDVKTTPTLMIHETGDPNVAIMEWSVSGHVISTGKPYEMSYATFVTFRNGLIVHYREYWDPLVFTAAMDGLQF